MRYNIFDGGNALALPWELTQSGVVGDFIPLPAEHHKRRHATIEKHIDTASRQWQGHYDGLTGESDKPVTVESGDEIVTHLAGRGWLLNQLAVHVKRAGIGKLAASLELADGSTAPILDADGAPFEVDLAQPGHYLGLFGDPNETEGGSSTVTVPAQTADATIPAHQVTIPAQDITVGGETVTIPEQTVTIPEQTAPVELAEQELTVTVPGSAAVGQNATILPENAYVVWTYTGEVIDEDEGTTSVMEGCFGVYLDAIDYHDEHECDCAPLPCDTEYPDPVCAPNRVPGNGDGGGNGGADV